MVVDHLAEGAGELGEADAPASGGHLAAERDGQARHAPHPSQRGTQQLAALMGGDARWQMCYRHATRVSRGRSSAATPDRG